MFTSDESCLKVDEITALSGANLLTKLEKGYENYIRDEEGIIQARSKALDYDLRINHMLYYSLNSSLVVKSIFDMMCTRIKNEFNSINIQYGYNKEVCLNVFINILKDVNNNLKLPLNYDNGSPGQSKFFENFILNLDKIQEFERLVKTIDSAIVLLNSKSNGAMQYSDSMSLEDWARYVVHAKPIQKERSQRRCASVHNASESIGTPSTASKSFQQASTKKKIMYGVMIASPFIAVGIYAFVVGAAVFNPVVAAGILVGAVVTAAILFGAVKMYARKQKIQIWK